MNPMLDHHNASWERRESWHGAERQRAGQSRGSGIPLQRAMLVALIAILAVTASRAGPQPQAQPGPAAGLPAAAVLAGPRAHIGVIGAAETGLGEVTGLLDPIGSESLTVVDVAGSAAPGQAAGATDALRALLADASVCVALALAPPGDLAEARRLADAAAGADKPVVLVAPGLNPSIRLLNRGNSRLSTAGTPAEGAARTLGLARLRGCAPRVEAAPLPARG
jgi:hypothetical protein